MTFWTDGVLLGAESKRPRDFPEAAHNSVPCLSAVAQIAGTVKVLAAPHRVFVCFCTITRSTSSSALRISVGVQRWPPPAGEPLYQCGVNAPAPSRRDQNVICEAVEPSIGSRLGSREERARRFDWDRSADHIRARSQNGCIERPNTWLHPNDSQKGQILFSCSAGAVHTWHCPGKRECPRSRRVLEGKRTCRRPRNQSVVTSSAA
jgi:hypothetical protein